MVCPITNLAFSATVDHSLAPSAQLVSFFSRFTLVALGAVPQGSLAEWYGLPGTAVGFLVVGHGLLKRFSQATVLQALFYLLCEV